ncbi:hypothetical protein D3C73_1634720 [compost metagenome]
MLQPRDMVVDPVKVRSEADMAGASQRTDMVDMGQNVLYGRLGGFNEPGNEGQSDDPSAKRQGSNLVVR